MPVQYKSTSLSMDLGSVVLLAGFFPFFFPYLSPFSLINTGVMLEMCLCSEISTGIQVVQVMVEVASR